MRAFATTLVVLVGCGPQETGLLARLPPCEVTTGDAVLDLHNGCVGQACVHQDLLRWSELLGAWSLREETGAQGSATWDEHGLIGRYRVSNRRMHGFELLPGTKLITDEGLGLGATFACFLLVHGEPPEATWMEVLGEETLVEAAWPYLGLTIGDDGDGEEGGPDGVVDRFVFVRP